MFIIAGLGNPGEKYTQSRHNTGRIAAEEILKKLKLNLEYNKKFNSLTAFADTKDFGAQKNKKKEILFLLPETFMNNSGLAVKKIITSKLKARDLIVIHDDLDIPIGKFKISFNRGSAGHKGVESIIKNIKTSEFIRIRVGVSPETPKGKIKKPKSEKSVDFIISDFKKEELIKIKNASKKIFEALCLIINHSVQKAMSEFN